MGFHVSLARVAVKPVKNQLLQKTCGPRGVSLRAAPISPFSSLDLLSVASIYLNLVVVVRTEMRNEKW